METKSIANCEAQIPIILGEPFPTTSNALINCRNGMLKLSFENMTVEMNILICKENLLFLMSLTVLNGLMCMLVMIHILTTWLTMMYVMRLIPSPLILLILALTPDPVLELKHFPDSLKYAFLGPNEIFLVIIASELIEDQKDKLLKVLREHKDAIRWTLGNIKGISPSIVQHKIHLKKNAN